MKNVYQIGSGDLTFDIIERIINENLKLELAPEAKDRIQKCRDYLDKKIKESDVPLYGITTGFGSLCSSEKLLKISKVSYAWKTYRKHFSRSLDFVEIIPRPRLVPL